jgi:adenosylcobyric acid synthase
MNGALMVCGTASDAGKSHLVSGLCRSLARRGLNVAPFKAQNMALNSFVTASGHEIGRAQAAQAVAAGVEAEVDMNPILLKPTGERTSQVVVMGRPVTHMDAAAYHEHKPRLLRVVLDALDRLRSRYDVVICEGAGNPAEINLLDRDIVNLRVAAEARMRAIVVGDIDRGGVFAALYGTVALLPPGYRDLVGGLVINKLRGDPALLGDGPSELEQRCGVPVIGVLPYVHDIGIDAEDSLALSAPRPTAREPAVADGLDVAAIQLPRLANFTDLDALGIEAGVGVRLVDSAAAVGQPDLVVLPGSKATVADLEWVRGRGLDRAMADAGAAGATVLGLCGGYQMLGRRIVDHVESGRGAVDGLGWLDASTEYCVDKVTRQRRGRAWGQRVSGYEIHHGRTRIGERDQPWIELDDVYGCEPEGATTADGSVVGTNLHGVLEEDGFRAAFLAAVAARRGRRFVARGVSFAGVRQAQLDRLADLVESHVDMTVVEKLMAEGAP